MTPPPLSFGSVYEDALARRSHELLGLGHARLVPADLAALEETEITGKLCDAMNEVLDSPDAPEWATIVTVVDDQPESVGGRTGKRRPRTDVCVRCTSPRPEHRFRFEAKRLLNTGSVAAYLGEDGMLALVRGYYGALRHGGMIGYVQAGTEREWANRIQTALQETPRAYDVVEPVAFVPLGVSVPEPVFCSEHHRSPPPGLTRITHTLLRCA
ncbi:MAG TPA: hypothetical protein VE974_02555 [Thermoanaerobaculia bacterium]|nr:hypothetical protein [Thermoanaerobaculia bacterium]